VSSFTASPPIIPAPHLGLPSRSWLAISGIIVSAADSLRPAIATILQLRPHLRFHMTTAVSSHCDSRPEISVTALTTIISSAENRNPFVEPSSSRVSYTGRV
ncbi:hypothetical protein V8G54_033307, partial [Vigna mungo]